MNKQISTLLQNFMALGVHPMNPGSLLRYRLIYLAHALIHLPMRIISNRQLPLENRKTNLGVVAEAILLTAWDICMFTVISHVAPNLAFIISQVTILLISVHTPLAVLTYATKAGRLAIDTLVPKFKSLVTKLKSSLGKAPAVSRDVGLDSAEPAPATAQPSTSSVYKDDVQALNYPRAKARIGGSGNIDDSYDVNSSPVMDSQAREVAVPSLLLNFNSERNQAREADSLQIASSVNLSLSRRNSA